MTDLGRVGNGGLKCRLLRDILYEHELTEKITHKAKFDVMDIIITSHTQSDVFSSAFLSSEEMVGSPFY